MNRTQSILAPIALGLGLTSGVNAQSYDQSGELDMRRPEVIAYSKEIRSRINTTIAPLGLRYDRMRGTSFRSDHIGIDFGRTQNDLGNSGVSFGLTYVRPTTNHRLLEAKKDSVIFGVNYVLNFK